MNTGYLTLFHTLRYSSYNSILSTSLLVNAVTIFFFSEPVLPLRYKFLGDIGTFSTDGAHSISGGQACSQQ